MPACYSYYRNGHSALEITKQGDPYEALRYKTACIFSAYIKKAVFKAKHNLTAFLKSTSAKAHKSVPKRMFFYYS